MLIQVWDSSTAQKRQYVRLRSYYGGVELVACTSHGEIIPGGIILRLPHDGPIERMYKVNPELGFTLDKYGRVRLKGGE